MIIIVIIKTFYERIHSPLLHSLGLKNAWTTKPSTQQRKIQLSYDIHCFILAQLPPKESEATQQSTTD